MLAQLDLVPKGSATAKAVDYSLKRWIVLTLPCRRGCAHRQQSSREQDPAVGTWTLEVVVCRIATQRKVGSDDHEFDQICAHERA